jgi:hypothetical protein
MRGKPMTYLFAVLVVAAAVLVAAPFVGAATNVHIAALKGSASFPAVNGKAKFGVDNGVRELEVQIEDANALTGQRLNVRIDGHLVGSMTVNTLGNARLRKTGSVVPAVHTGSKAVVRRAANGQLVASGIFN